jgi:hypothetical protein
VNLSRKKYNRLSLRARRNPVPGIAGKLPGLIGVAARYVLERLRWIAALASLSVSSVIHIAFIVHSIKKTAIGNR